MLYLFAIGATRGPREQRSSPTTHATFMPEQSTTAWLQWLAHLHVPVIKELGEEKGSNMLPSHAMEGLLEWLSDRFGGQPEAIIKSPQPRGLGLSAHQLLTLRAALQPMGDDIGAKLRRGASQR